MSNYLGTADSIKVVSDEAGFELWIETDDGTFGFNIHAVAPELFEQVKRVIGSWLSEGEAVRRSAASAVFACGPEDIDESAGLADSGPKHPRWHSVNADHYDSREKGGRTL